jgi:hypothetical protein
MVKEAVDEIISRCQSINYSWIHAHDSPSATEPECGSKDNSITEQLPNSASHEGEPRKKEPNYDNLYVHKPVHRSSVDITDTAKAFDVDFISFDTLRPSIYTAKSFNNVDLDELRKTSSTATAMYTSSEKCKTDYTYVPCSLLAASQNMSRKQSNKSGKRYYKKNTT